MNRTFTKHLFFLAIFTLFTLTGAFAQTVTVGTVDPGPYGQGSTITVPITINDASGCINQGNVYNLYLSDAAGNFAPGTLIGSYTGFYAPFVNGVIPAGTPAGAGYKVEVKTTSPVTTSAPSAAFTVNTNTGVTASASSNQNVTTGVFGKCIGAPNSPFIISNTSAAGTTETASFFNEQTQAFEGTNIPIPTTGYTFTAANTTNYTVIVRTTDVNGTVGTTQYELINNPVHQNIGSAGNNFVCLVSGRGDLSFSIDISALSAGGIGVNYPGFTYILDWGDGTSTTFTYCQLKALAGVVTHTFTLPSCGHTGANGDSNSFLVSLSPVSPFCGQITTAPAISAKVIITPTTSFAAPAVACVGTALTIPNTSNPGPDYSLGATSTCAANPGALYDWTLDGVAVPGYQGVLLSKSFVFPATTTAGVHTLLLHSELPPSGIGCQAPDYTQTICFENPPQPIFSIPAQICIGSGPVTATNTSVIDATCGVDTYQWTVTGPGTVTYAGGTNSTSAQPQFVFPVAGIYTVQLGINSGGCGTITAPAQTIRVDSNPTATLSPDITICGNNLTFTFSPTQTVTKTTLTGTAQTQPTTYTWTITGGAFTFLGGTNANTQYPQILFADFATYTVKVTHTNACGTVSATQVLTFVQSPTVNAGPDQNICASSPVASLSGTIVGSYTSYQWVGGNGTFSAGRNSLITNYTPSNTEINAGTVTLTLQANTALPVPCNTVTDDITINITPTAIITSPPTASTCSGQTLNYTITANNGLATFTWTAAVTSGAATGFTASGSGANISDLITNTGNVDAVVAYSILPTIGSCPGTPFTLNVTVHPLPVVTAAPVNSPNCDNQPADIILTSNVANTGYTWTSTATAGMSGNTTQSTVLVTNSIQDILINSGTTPGTVTYTVTPYNGSCPGTPVVTSVTVEPVPGASIPGPDDEVCATTTYTLQGNTPSPGTGKWTVIQGPAGATFSNDTDPHAVVSGLIPGNLYQFQWTITASANCPSNSNVVNITIDQAPIGGTTSAPAEVCSGSNGGTITLAGQFGTVVRWESSIDNGATWQPITNLGGNQAYSNLTQTTQYRAILHNGVCADVPSTATTITVDAPPVASMPGPNDEVCGATTYSLHGNSPAPGTGKWTVAGGPAGAIFSDDTNPNAVVSGLIPGNVYQFQWTITGTASCPPNSNVVTITIDKAPVGGTTSAPAEVCSGSNSGTITLAGQFGSVVRWESSIDNGATWQPIVNLSTTQVYTNLTQTTQYRAILHSSNICTDVPSTPTTITVDAPPVASVPGPNDEVCSTTTYNLHGNSPAPGTGKWTVASGPAGAIFSDDTNPNAVVSGLIPGNAYQFRWTITGTASCPPNSNAVTITIDKAPVGGTTSSPATVCAGGNNGTISLAGQSGTIDHWESSIDNGATWQPITNTTIQQTYSGLTQTTQYRAILKGTGVCPDQPSTATTITVNPQTPIANAGPGYDICNETIITLNGNNPAPFNGTWTQTAGPAVTIVNPSNYQTQVTGLSRGNVYTFKWTIIGLPPCGNTESSITIGAYADVIPSFTMDQTKGCGPTTVNFTNTSTPAPTGTFVWDFGDGSATVTAVNPPSHVFQPSTDGSPKTYIITLTPTSNCNSQVPYTAQITISPAVPVAKLLPNQTSACGSFVLKAANLSPGDNVQYDFYLKDANGNIVQHLTYPDKSQAVFQTINPTVATNYTVYVVATDQCGNQATSVPEIISVAPSNLVSQIQIKGDIQSVCLGSPVTFQNISTGGDRFTITVYDANKNVILTLPAGTGDFNYTPTATGTYYVSITAGNEGCGDAPASALKQFNVYPDPQAAFTYVMGNDYTVSFNNTTPDAGNIPASSLNYKWDFGDGSPTESTYVPNAHQFDYTKSPFTVTLTATTPGTTCLGVATQTITIKFLGDLFLPNAFIPASSNKEINTYRAKGFGMKTWHMQIFNNFGQLVWETRKLDSNGAPVEGWDGTYKGQIVQQGVYIWQITATLLNGEDWKGMSYNNGSPSHTGAIHLIR